MASDNPKPENSGRSASGRWLLYVLILFSGAAGLVYEVIWARQLTLFIGNTAIANAAVLTAFMTGLALGSIYLGKRADRIANPLRLYALLEILIGLYGATTPWLFDLLQNSYAQIAGVVGVTGPYSHIPRFMVAVLAMLVPTFMMGGTLPLLVKHFTSRLTEAQSVTSRVYGINTLGATLGAFSAGYILLPAMGITSSLLMTALVNVMVGLGVYALLAGRRDRKASPNENEARLEFDEPPDVLQTPGLLLLGFALSGFAALLYQVVWIHALVLVIGISVYAFSTVLTVYLAGIGLGSLAIGRFFRYRSSSQGLRLAFVLQLVIALTAVASLTLISELPVLFVKGWDTMRNSFLLFQGYMFVLAGMVILVPTLLLGALFPLISSIWSHARGAVGRGVGEAYGANAIGTIAGSAIGGLFILGWLGMEHSLWLASGISVVVAALFWFLATQDTPLPYRTIPLPASLLMLAVAIHLAPGLDRQMLQSEVFRHSERYTGGEIRAAIKSHMDDFTFEFYKEGINGTVSVISWEEQDGSIGKAMMTNGKVDASTGSDVATQLLLAHIPMFLHPEPADVMVIGLGSGMTAGSALQVPAVEALDILEISPEVVEASEAFRDHNNDVLSDPRTTMMIADARNYLLATDKTYDVVISEPSHSWVTGVANLFTRDFLELVRNRLSEGGMLAQWYHMYGVNRESLKSMLSAVSDVFPHYSLWYIGGGDIILVSSNEPLNLDYEEKVAYFAPEKTLGELERLSVGSVEQLMNYIMMSSQEVREKVGDGVSNSDDRPIVEFNAPKSVHDYTTQDNIRMLFGERTSGEFRLPFQNLSSAEGSWVNIPFMGVRVYGRSSTVSEPQWNVVRQFADPNDRTSSALVGGMNGNVVLQKSWGEVTIHTTMVQRGPHMAQVLFPMMNEELPIDEYTLGGELERSDGVVFWQAGPSEEPGAIKVVLGQRCERASGYDNFNLISSELPADFSVHEQVGFAVQQLASLVECLAQPQPVLQGR